MAVKSTESLANLRLVPLRQKLDNLRDILDPNGTKKDSTLEDLARQAMTYKQLFKQMTQFLSECNIDGSKKKIELSIDDGRPRFIPVGHWVVRDDRTLLTNDTVLNCTYYGCHSDF